jgi:pimeloyl-ACP methyl ester carboxylesterase
MAEEFPRNRQETLVHIPIDSYELEGNLTIPGRATGIVAFAHGSGSSRHSPRNKAVAGVLNQGSLATLLIDLLTAEEDEIDIRTRELRFNIDLLANRMIAVTDWLNADARTQNLEIGLFGASTGAAASLRAAAERPDSVYAVVSRGGRPDLAMAVLAEVKAPTLLIVGERDEPVIGMNQQAMAKMQVETRLEIVPNASHLFEEPGALDEVARLAGDWFQSHLSTRLEEERVR